MNTKSPIAIAVFANRDDFWFTKICVASIRYYYPKVKIYLIKDLLKGDFNTVTLCRRFDVQSIRMDKRFYGWSAAKIRFIVYNKLPEGRYLTLDSDIIFAGAVLEKLEADPADFIVHAEHHPQPLPPSVKQNYFDIEKVKTLYPGYEYPGFFFNCGQMVITSGMVDKAVFRDCYDFDHYPYYSNRELFPMVDQSILNCILPVLHRRNTIRLSGADFMLWSLSYFAQEGADDPEKIRDRSALPYLIHYAGDHRTYKIGEMRGKNMLSFFKDFYYSKLTPSERRFSDRQDRWLSQEYLNRLLYRRNRVLMKFFSID
jgi:hypothetical protein